MSRRGYYAQYGAIKYAHRITIFNVIMNYLYTYFFLAVWFGKSTIVINF